MRIAITGASGNLGTALLLRLGGEGGVDEHEFVAVSRRQPPDMAPYSWAEWHCTELADPDSADDLATAFADVDAVVHLAWTIQPTWNRDYLQRANVDGTRRVAEAAQRAGVRHLIHMSSAGTYAPGPESGEAVDENWPHTGVETLPYSVDKAAAEQIVDLYDGGDMTVTRVRPGLVLQDAAASEITRYFLGPLVPSAVLRPGVMRFAPVPRELRVQVVHADDVADAIAAILEHRAGGAFNVATDPPVDRAAFAEAFGGVGPALSTRLLRPVVDATWRLHLQPTHPGWIDLAVAMPLVDTSALRALGWQPQRDAVRVLADFVAALGRGAGRPGPLLYRRSFRPGTGPRRSPAHSRHGSARASERMNATHERRQ